MIYKKMLVPLDGSELAEAVLPYTRELASRLGVDAIYLHVSSPEEHAFTGMHRSYIQNVANTVKGQLEEMQQKTGSGTRRIEVQGDLVVGDAAEEILDYTERNDIDFILIATHGYSGIKRWALGSVADKVLRTSKVPVWLVRSPVPEEIVYDRWPHRTILVPLDGSKLAESLLPHAEALSRLHSGREIEVVLIRVFEPPFITADYPEGSMRLSWEEHVERITNHFKKIAAQYLTGVERQLKNAGINVRSEVLMGQPADEIIDYASKNPLNLIVMATHGRSGVTRWAYGSVADRVLHGVPNPVFLVRAE